MAEHIAFDRSDNHSRSVRDDETSQTHSETQVIELATGERVRMLIEDMRARWARGERPLCDEYLSRLPDPTFNVDATLDLIYCEYLLRREYGLDANADSFVVRFPKFESAIRRQLDLESAFQETSTSPAPDPASAHPLLRDRVLPAPLGRYLVVAPLDAGGQATVYLGLHPTLRKNVLLKLSRHAIRSGIDSTDGLLQEGRLLATLEHENLVRVYDVDVVDGYPLVVMDYVPGQSLDQYCRSHRIAPDAIAKIILAVAQAVDYVHQKNLLHLDIKPKNIIVDESGVPRLIDFGLARLVDAWNPSSTDDRVSGTLQYMPPEQIRGDSQNVGPATDVFALGGVLYFLLTGKAPYPAGSVKELVSLVQAGKWDATALAASPSPRLQRVCRRALAPAVADRYGSVTELVRDLERAVSTRRMAIVATLLSLGVLLLLGIGTWVYLSARPPRGNGSANRAVVSGTSVPKLVVTSWNMGRFESLEDRLPLTNGDELHLEAVIPPGVQAALMHHDIENGWTELRRWQEAKDERVVHYPDVESTTPLEGEPGPQVILLVAGEDVASLVNVLNERQADLRQVSNLSSYSLVHVDNVEVKEEATGKGLGGPISRREVERSMPRALEAVQRQIRGKQGAVSGVAFFKE